MEIIVISHNFQSKIAKMAFCTFLISKTINTIDMELIKLNDTYVHCALGYIKINLFNSLVTIVGQFLKIRFSCFI